jgi:hypothetical protein
LFADFGFPISTGQFEKPSVAFDGANYLVGWESSGDIYGARLNPEGTVLDPHGLPIATGQASETAPAMVAGSAGRAAITYVREGQVFLRFLDENKMPPPPPPPPQDAASCHA